MTEKYPEKIVECIDKHFPKGDKRRGDALVLQAVAFLEGKELKLKEVEKVIDERIQRYDDLRKHAKRKLEDAHWKGIIIELIKIKEKLGIKEKK